MENDMSRKLRPAVRAIVGAGAAVWLSGLSACQEPPAPPRNAAEKARFARDMEEVEAGQARTDANVAEIAAARSAERRLQKSESELAEDQPK